MLGYRTMQGQANCRCEFQGYYPILAPFLQETCDLSIDPLPKDAPWNEQVQTTYDMGYQQQSQHQPSLVIEWVYGHFSCW